MKTISLIFLLLWSPFAFAELSGLLRLSHHVYYNDDADSYKRSANQLYAEFDYTKNYLGRHQIELGVALRYDPQQHFVGRQNPLHQQPQDQFNTAHAELGLRRLVWRYYAEDFQLSLGKQQTVWGNADGIRLLNVVNPYDFREFILSDFSQARLPLWGMQLDFSWQALQWQFVVNLDAQNNLLAGADQPFNLSLENVLNKFSSANKTAQPLVLKVEKNSGVSKPEVGMAVSGFWRGWDWGLHVFYQSEDFPVFSRDPELSNVLVATNERGLLVGSTVSTSLGDVVIRNETLYSPNRVHSSYTGKNINASGFDNIVGIDWSLGGDSVLSMQWHYSIVPHANTLLLRKRREDLLTAVMQNYWHNRQLKTRLQLYHHLQNRDSLLRASIEYELNDRVNLRLAADVFNGKRRGNFGQFDEQDRLVFSTQLYF